MEHGRPRRDDGGGRARRRSARDAGAERPCRGPGTSDVPDAAGTFDPEEVYGRFPPGVRSRPESQRARADRKRGISVPGLPRRSLVVYGDDCADERGRSIARFYGIAEAYFPGVDHWGLVLDPRVRSRVFEFLLHGS